KRDLVVELLLAMEQRERSLVIAGALEILAVFAEHARDFRRRSGPLVARERLVAQALAFLHAAEAEQRESHVGLAGRREAGVVEIDREAERSPGEIERLLVVAEPELDVGEID